ncbi:MAG: Denitrification system component NirT [Burkholderiales bacterium]|nr:MAG: Denitrification system component NirT [Burkholderiales bacterium]
MADQEREATKQAGALSRLWRWLRRPSGTTTVLTLLVVGFASGIVFWGGFNTVVEATNTMTFCVSCHEMRDNVYVEYKETIHYSNRTGVRATCSDCHVPRDWTHKMVRKVQATRELYGKVMGTIDTKEKFEAKRLHLARREWARMKSVDSRECRNCHGFEGMNTEAQKPRAKRAHELAQRDNETCIDCHKGIAHKKPEGMTEEDED